MGGLAAHRTAMAEIDSEMAAGRFGMAARNLEKLLAWRPGSGEAAYALGVCEQARGRYPAAELAWARVAPGSAFTHLAILARLRLCHDTGRLADAEKLVIDAAQDPRNDRTDLLVLLVPIFSQTGRSDEAAALIEARWEYLHETGEATQEQSVNLVRLHIELNGKAPAAEQLRAYLDHVGGLAPDDDRVWLGRANLAIQTGAHDEARRWLDACQRRRRGCGGMAGPVDLGHGDPPGRRCATGPDERASRGVEPRAAPSAPRLALLQGG